MRSITQSTFVKATAIFLLAIFSVFFLISGGGVLMLSQFGVFFDDGVELRYIVYENAVHDVENAVLYRYLYPKLRGNGSQDADTYFADRYSSDNSNIFFSFTDENGKVVYQNYSEPYARFEKTIEGIAVNVPIEVYNDGNYFSLVLQNSKAPSLLLRVSSEAGYKKSIDLEIAESDSPTVPVNLTFRGYIRKDLTAKDKLYHTMGIVDFAVAYRYLFVAVFIVCFLVAVILFIFLMCATGHRRGKDGITLNPLDKIPLELYLAFAGIVLTCLFYAFWLCITLQGLSILIIGTGLVVTLIAAELILLSVILTLANRIKYGAWWKSTLVFKILYTVYRLFRFFFRKARHLTSNLPIIWKAVIVFLGFAFVELIFLVSAERQTLVFWWFIARIVMALVLFFLLIDIKKLRFGSEELARGNTEYRIDTHGMYGELKKYGTALNHINEGLQAAVNDRMKSERLKTELITNVSHDLKTPLTSIVNYVDLMKKEDIQPEKAREYLEVLDRQSRRLKKLTLDLLDASKASTGNMPVNLEKTDIGVFLSQLTGEYGEKLATADLELIVTPPELVGNESVYIFADGRLLWRVFDNLMNNIVKYAQSGTRVYVSAEIVGQEPSQKVVFSFKNISKFPLNISSDELMERFVRGDASRNTEGSGLGLSIAKSLCELQHGTFELVVDGDLFKALVTFERRCEAHSNTRGQG